MRHGRWVRKRCTSLARTGTRGSPEGRCMTWPWWRGSRVITRELVRCTKNRWPSGGRLVISLGSPMLRWDLGSLTYLMISTWRLGHNLRRLDIFTSDLAIDTASLWWTPNLDS